MLTDVEKDLLGRIAEKSSKIAKQPPHKAYISGIADGIAVEKEISRNIKKQKTENHETDGE